MSDMFLPFRRYAEFAGRSRRPEFWLFFLFLFLVYFVLFAVIWAVALSVMTRGGGVQANIMAAVNSFGVFGVIMVVFWLATFLPWLAVSARRLHDINLSGWWLAIPYGLWFGANILNFVAGISYDPMLRFVGQVGQLLWLASGIASIVVFCLPGTRGANRYGPDPLGPIDVADVFA